MSGLFISFEGIDGVGKSTQIDLLEKHLGELGRKTLRSFEPGGTELGQEIRNMLLHRKGQLGARAEALLFAADRAHHSATKVKPALAEGTDVILDRYLDSSVAYQGAGRELDATEIRNLSLFAVQGLLPDLTILLDMDAAAALARRDKTGNTPDRLESEKVEFFEAVRQGYLQLAAAEPQRFFVVDATASVEEMAAVIRARVDELLN
jgi:dTMP kinase